MATLIDANKGQNNGAGTSLNLDATISGDAGDWCVVVPKHEGASDAGILACNIGGVAMTPSIAYASHANGDLHGRVFHHILTSSGAFNPEMTNSSRSFRSMLAWIFRPGGGNTFELGNTGLGSATNDTPTTTSATSDGTGFGIMGLPIYGDRTFTPTAPWLEAANHNGTYLVRGGYQLAPTAGGITGDATWSATVEWINLLVLFREVVAGPPPTPGYPEPLRRLFRSTRPRPFAPGNPR